MRATCPETYVACVRDCGKGSCKLAALVDADGWAKPRPGMLDTMMDVARLMARRSTCERLRVGCVITNPQMTSIYALGYNGNYRGGPNQCDREDPGNCGCLHAEDNALVKLRTEERGLILFTTVSPCVACAKRIVNQGNVLTVWMAEAHRDLDAGAAILAVGGVSMRRLGSGTGTEAVPAADSFRTLTEPCDDDAVAARGVDQPKRYRTVAVLDAHTPLVCREADGLLVTEPSPHNCEDSDCRCVFVSLDG